MKQLLLPLIGTVAFILILGLLVKNPGKFVNTNSQKQEENMVKINNTEIKVSIADSNDERAKGLSGKTSLEEKEGMFFIFDQKDEKPTFWMKDMIIAIDIIWIDNERIIQIDKNIKAPEKGTPDSELTKYSPKESVDYVLEVNSGFSDKYEFAIGDQVDLSLIK